MLVVETGWGDPDANSYASLADVRAYAAKRGYVLPADDAALETLIYLATDYVDGFRGRFQGVKSFDNQALQWPRMGVAIDCIAVPYDTIPVPLVQAIAQLCVEQHAGVELNATAVGGDAAIIEETVGPLTTKYAAPASGSSASGPNMPKVAALLAPLFSACGNGGLFRTVRV